MAKRTGLASVLLLLFLAWPGCAWVQAPQRFERIEKEIAFVRGTVPSEGWQGGPIVVVLSRDAAAGARHEVDFLILYQPGTYWFYTEPGSYQLAAFEQSGRRLDMIYRPGRPALLYGEGASLALAAGERRDGLALGERLSTQVRLGARFDLSPDSSTTRLAPYWRNLGEVVDLDDPRVSLEAGRAGFTDPDRFSKEFGTGLYFLEPYAPHKVPVLFVHGLTGAPVQFESLVGSLDRERFQPWLLIYPSVVPVGIVATIVNDMMNVLQERYRFGKAHVVAHSLGGLVTRAYIREYARNSSRRYLARFVSIGTPWGGAAGAGLYDGVRVQGTGGDAAEDLRSDPDSDPHARGYVSLVDLAPDSGFLGSLFSSPLPAGVRFHLVFGYRGIGASLEPGDGVVPLKSALRSEAQREASGQRGFAESHMGLLESPEVASYLSEVLGAPF